MLTVEPGAAGPRPSAVDGLRSWSTRQWVTAGGGALATALIIGLPTDVIPNPVFGRPVAVTWWSVPVLVATAVLGGLLLGTYVRTGPADGAPGASDGAEVDEGVDDDRTTRRAGLGGLLAFFAVGCPVCNKLVVVALGTSGALSWFAPIQPVLAVASVVLLAVALRSRLRGAGACAVPA